MCEPLSEKYKDMQTEETKEEGARMTFKTKEELIEEYKQMFGEHYGKLTHADGIRNAFKSFAERVELYKKYEGKYKLFNTDYPKIHVSLPVDDETDHFEFYRLWNTWLFDYCFKDVLE